MPVSKNKIKHAAAKCRKTIKELGYGKLKIFIGALYFSG